MVFIIDFNIPTCGQSKHWLFVVEHQMSHATWIKTLIVCCWTSSESCYMNQNIDCLLLNIKWAMLHESKHWLFVVEHQVSHATWIKTLIVCCWTSSEPCYMNQNIDCLLLNIKWAMLHESKYWLFVVEHQVSHATWIKTLIICCWTSSEPCYMNQNIDCLLLNIKWAMLHESKHWLFVVEHQVSHAIWFTE